MSRANGLATGKEATPELAKLVVSCAKEKTDITTPSAILLFKLQNLLKTLNQRLKLRQMQLLAHKSSVALPLRYLLKKSITIVATILKSWDDDCAVALARP